MKVVGVVAAVSLGLLATACGSGSSEVMTPLLLQQKLAEGGIQCVDGEITDENSFYALTCGGGWWEPEGFAVLVMAPEQAQAADACANPADEVTKTDDESQTAYAANWWSMHGDRSPVVPEDIARVLDGQVGPLSEGLVAAIEFACNQG